MTGLTFWKISQNAPQVKCAGRDSNYSRIDPWVSLTRCKQ